MVFDNICFPFMAKISGSIPILGRAGSPPVWTSAPGEIPGNPRSGAIFPGPATRLPCFWARETLIVKEQGPDPNVFQEVGFPGSSMHVAEPPSPVRGYLHFSGHESGFLKLFPYNHLPITEIR